MKQPCIHLQQDHTPTPQRITCYNSMQAPHLKKIIPFTSSILQNKLTTANLINNAITL